MVIDFYKMDKNRREAAEDVYNSLKAFEEEYQNNSSAESLSAERMRLTQTMENFLNVSLDEQIEISKLSNGEWLCTSYRILFEIADPFVAGNKFDDEFFRLIDICRTKSSDTLFELIKYSVFNLKNQSLQKYNYFVEYFAKYPLWGTLEPEKNDFETLKRRAVVLKRHSYDFLWLYRKLADYLSKRTLCSILFNWMIIDTNEIRYIKSIFPDYYEPDIFPNNKDDIFVDIGAYVGDSIINYIKTYGDDYKKIYAYEISPQSCEIMRQNLKNLHDIEIRCKGVSSEAGEFFMAASSEMSSNHLSVSGDSSSERVETVALDEDIPEGFTFLKMDIEGAEYDALRGSEQIIRRCKPKLAVCVYHGYDDLWRIPALIDSYNSGYSFYLRHNGGNLIPTEFVLLARQM